MKGHEDRQWLSDGGDSFSNSVLLGKEKLMDHHQCLSELKGLELEGFLGDDSCERGTDDERQKFQRMTPDGKPLPLHNNSTLNVEFPGARKKKRNKNRCQPCEATGMPSIAPLTKAHCRTHTPKHPDCEICRLTKPQASPHLRISDKRKTAFGKVDDDGNFVTVHRPLGAHKLPERFWRFYYCRPYDYRQRRRAIVAQRQCGLNCTGQGYVHDLESPSET